MLILNVGEEGKFYGQESWDDKGKWLPSNSRQGFWIIYSIHTLMLMIIEPMLIREKHNFELHTFDYRILFDYIVNYIIEVGNITM